jgi:hypothetical protein
MALLINSEAAIAVARNLGYIRAYRGLKKASIFPEDVTPLYVLVRTGTNKKRRFRAYDIRECTFIMVDGPDFEFEPIHYLERGQNHATAKY